MKTFPLSRAFFILTLCFSSFTMSAITKRALLIGIDIYVPTATTPEVFANRGKANERSGWENLNGCLNDAKSMRSIIMARYGFMENNIDTLFNQKASRQGILDGIQKLINTSQPGDVVFFYYAGHGSQVKNSKSYDGTGWDQTIVPADLWDIRNKELSKLFNQLLDKGVTLTLIFDSCHSGAIARGNSLPVTFKERKAPPVDWDANDDSKEQIVPEKRGALLFSAAQRNQTAKEAADLDGTAHGAFTLALIKAINSSSANQSAERLYTSILGIIKSDQGPTFQDPIMGGTDERKKAGIFNDKVTENSAKTFIAVMNVTATQVTLRGGHELSIYEGCRFIKVTGKDTITLEVTKVERIGESSAIVVGKGNISNLKNGDLVEMVSWVNPAGPTLRIWAPETTMTAAQLKKEIAPVMSFLGSNYKLVSDPTKKAPANVIQFNEGKWLVTSAGHNESHILSALTVANIKAVIPIGSEVFLQLPPSTELTLALNKKLGPGSPNSAVEFTKNPLLANYILVGRSEKGSLAYSLIRPNISDQDSSFRNSFPVRTNWCSYGIDTTADSLSVFAVRLGKISSWLNLKSPADNYPYSLVLVNGKKQIVQPGEKMIEEQEYHFALKLDSANAPSSRIIPRYCYIFTIDATGQMTLFYPSEEYGAESNLIKYIPGSSPMLMNVLPVNDSINFTIGPPFGNDTYFLLTSDVAVSTSVFKSKGVMTRGIKGTKGPLDDLLMDNGAQTRAPKPKPPVVTHWSIQKFTFQSLPKGK